MPKVIKKSKLKKTAKSLFSTLVRLRDGACKRCGKTTNLQCSHIKSVGAHPKLQFNPANAMALCHRCHIYWWHKEPTEAAEWFKTKFPEISAYLDEKVRDTSPSDVDYEILIELFKEGIRQIQLKGGEQS